MDVQMSRGNMSQQKLGEAGMDYFVNQFQFS